MRLINFTLNPKILEKEKVITDFLTENKIIFTEDEIRKSFKECEERYCISDELTKCNRLTLTRHYYLIKREKTGAGVWKALKDFANQEHDFEFDSSGNKHVDFLEYLKTVQTDIDDVVIDLLCGKIKNKDKSGELKKEFKEWQQFRMLRWCVVDYSSMNNLSVLNEKIWRLLISIFL